MALLDPRGRVSVVTSLDGELKNAIGGFVPAQHLAVRSSIDGRPIDAWLLVPRGASAAHRAPIVLDIHGGPFAAYGDRFFSKVVTSCSRPPGMQSSMRIRAGRPDMAKPSRT